MNSKALTKKAGYAVVAQLPDAEWSNAAIPVSVFVPILEKVASDFGVDLPPQEPWDAETCKNAWNQNERSIELGNGVLLKYQSRYDSVWLDVPDTTGRARQINFRKGAYYINWSGMGYLSSPKPFDMAIVEEISATKAKELESAREKRRSAIKNSMDAVRLLLEKNGIKCQRISGAVRVRADMCCSVDFVEIDNSTRIKVRFMYNDGDYIQDRKITTLHLASPHFEEHAIIIVHNFSRMWDVIVGDRELKPMPFKIEKMK